MQHQDCSAAHTAANKDAVKHRGFGLLSRFESPQHGCCNCSADAKTLQKSQVDLSHPAERRLQVEKFNMRGSAKSACSEIFCVTACCWTGVGSL